MKKSKILIMLVILIMILINMSYVYAMTEEKTDGTFSGGSGDHSITTQRQAKERMKVLKKSINEYFSDPYFCKNATDDQLEHCKSCIQEYNQLDNTFFIGNRGILTGSGAPYDREFSNVINNYIVQINDELRERQNTETGDNSGDGSGDDSGDGSGDNSGDGSGDNSGDNSGDGSGDGSGDNSGDGSGRTQSSIISTDDFRPNDLGTDDYQQAFDITGKIVNALTVIGIAISLIMTIVLGIKYMCGSVEERADYKKTMMPMFIGMSLIFASSTIVSVIYSIVSKL